MGTNTGIGIGIGIPFKNNALGGDRPYLPPELKARLIGVWDNYGKKNTDADRNIIKNKIPNAGGDLEILNAAYKLNSGFGEYKEDFTSWRIYPNIEVTDNVITTNGNFNSTWFIYKHANENEINEMNIKVSGIPEGGIIRYFYIPDETATIPVSYNISEDGVHHLPKSKLSSNRVSVGFTVSSSYDWNNIRIEQLSDFGGAFVTDGINDIIISQKTLQEMGVTKDFTIVSMIHQISWRGSGSVPLTNYIRPTDNIYVRNQVADIGKTGIYGYVMYDVNNTSVSNSHVINTVLGDKNDYSVYTVGNLSQGKFSVQGYIDGNDNIREISSVAHYWTFALLGKATEDDINLIIAYFNLDRTLKPDIRCNIERQGITNDNHADFNDRLIDYSGNGRDIQMYNLAWKGGSGIAAKPFETIKDYTIVSDEARQKLTIYNEFSYKIKSNTPSYYWTVQSIIRDNTSYQVTIITDKDCYWINATSFINSEGNKESIRKKYPVLANTPTQVIICGLDQFEYPEGIEPTSAISYVDLKYAGEITITFIPSHKGGLLLDGVSDFGKVTRMPVYKDYTFIIDYERISYASSEKWIAGVVSKSHVANQGAFILMTANTKVESTKQAYSFGGVTSFNRDDFTRALLYQSKYKCGDVDLTVGEGVDSDTLWLGTFRDNDQRFFNGAIYSLMSFPYSMSEFLIERQLKKHKLGTLYPDMVEFRPIISSNIPYDKIEFFNEQWTKRIYPGDYVEIGATIKANLYLNNYDISTITSLTSSQFESVYIDRKRQYYDVVLSGIKKSPQKITMTIEQDENYVKFEPVITSNVEYVRLDFYLNNYQKKINIGDYIPKDAYIRANLYLKNNIDELTVFTFNGVNIGYRRSSVDDTAFNIGQIYNYDSSQEVNITIDEYIRFEDIVQPYPVLLRFKDESGKEVSWGGKFKVGSTITRIGSATDSNLLPNIYNIFGLLLNDNQVTSSKAIVEKTMVFKAKSYYMFDNNEPNCILSPRLLRIPNSSYKILGHIPDISGHGNHGVIHNSAYEGASGADGESDFELYTRTIEWLTRDGCLEATSNSITVLREGPFSITMGVGNSFPSGDVIVEGLKEGSKIELIGDSAHYDIDSNGHHKIPYGLEADMADRSISFYGDCKGVTIKGAGKYEGAFCFDGVDDFVTIPTLSHGGKQVLMKVNWSKNTFNEILYDQRENLDIHTFAIFNHDSDTVTGESVVAYNSKNNGNTYIDGILNYNIKASELKDIEHNITITNESVNTNNSISPTIGTNKNKDAHYAKMALYDFMLFDKISTDDKIKELNEYVGIEAKV